MWSVSLGDLEIVTELLGSPGRFLHYLTSRIALEATAFSLNGDETDLLGYYSAKGFTFDFLEAAGLHVASIAGLSSEVDRYVFEQYEANVVPVSPIGVLPPGFVELLADIESLEAGYTTDSTMALLTLETQSRSELTTQIEAAKRKAESDNEPHSFSLVAKKDGLGVSFVAMPGGSQPDQLVRTAMTYGVLKKHNERSAVWVALGWTSGTERSVDLAGYLSFPAQEDAFWDELSSQILFPVSPVRETDVKG